MAKFKVGDKVRVVKNITSLSTKDQYIGKEYTISKVHPFGSNRTNLQSYEIEAVYVVYDSELELVSLPEIHITTNGTATTAVLKENGKITKKVSSKCSPYDVFNFKTGAKIAMDRLLENEKQIPDEFFERFRSEKIAVNCETEEEAIKFCNALHEKGYKWRGGESLLNNSTWGIFRRYTRYSYMKDNCFITSGVVRGSSNVSGGIKCITITYTDLINGKLPPKKEPFKPYVVIPITDKKYGYIGEETKLTDLAGTKLFVGDTVKLYSLSRGSFGETVVVKEEKDCYVFGVALLGIFTKGRNGDWSIIKCRSHSDIKDGETVDGIKYVKSE